MGVFKMFSSSSLPNQPAPQNNPDPSNFIIIKSYDRRDYCAVMIRYPDCDNYEGLKILVFNELLEKITRQTVLDPHFTDKSGLYCVPIARFEPTQQGWSDAKYFVKSKGIF